MNTSFRTGANSKTWLINKLSSMKARNLSLERLYNTLLTRINAHCVLGLVKSRVRKTKAWANSLFPTFSKYPFCFRYFSQQEFFFIPPPFPRRITNYVVKVQLFIFQGFQILIIQIKSITTNKVRPYQIRKFKFPNISRFLIIK